MQNMSTILEWADTISLSQQIADDIWTEIRKLQVTIEALKSVLKQQNTAGSRGIDSTIAHIGMAFPTSTAQNEFDEETAASGPIPGRIGLATTRIHDPG